MFLTIEDDAAFLSLFRDYLAHYSPASPLEARLVQELAHIDWSLTRFRALETGFLNGVYDRQNSPFSGIPPAPDPLARLRDGLSRPVDEFFFASFLSLRISRLLADRDRTLRSLTRLRRSVPNSENHRFPSSFPPQNQPQPLDSSITAPKDKQKTN